MKPMKTLTINDKKYEIVDEAARGDAGTEVTITVDDKIDENSANPVQNAVLAAKFAEMEQSIANLHYAAIQITSIRNNVSVAELGSLVQKVTINWSLNKTPSRQTINGQVVGNDERSIAINEVGVTSNKTYTLTVTDERGATAAATTKIVFYNGVYYGVGAENVDLLTLTKKLQSSKAITFTVDAAEGQYIVFALPTRYGTPNFSIGGFDGGFKKERTIAFTNAYGFAESYDVWMSDNTGLGDTTVTVS